jgi:hypothetical protein
MATGIGSVPFTAVEDTCRGILKDFPRIPYWPQFVQRSHLEDMILQFSEGLPLLTLSKERRALVIPTDAQREAALVAFYEHYMARDLDHFAISRDHAPGLHTLLDLLSKEDPSQGFVKGQTVGPLTFAAGVMGADGKALLHDPELLEAMASGLAIKALWQVRQLAGSGRKPILFLDEPYLSGFGSAFSPIQRREVIRILRKVMGDIRASAEVLIGIHCCGNTDWSMLLEAGPDIINFDAFDYAEPFLLYREEIVRFLGDGGFIAWGIVPTANLSGRETLEGLSLKLKRGLEEVSGWGLDPALLEDRSLLTPSCGMGTMNPEDAASCVRLLAGLSKHCAEQRTR